MSQNESGKKYKIGYVPGVFDLFHIGHLNLIRKSKEQSEYLIAGVLTDELVMHFKGKKPYIPFEERIAIVEAIKEVDEVVAVDFSNTVKMDAWKLYHYDAYFSGDDHGHEWDHEKAALNEVGSDIVFFPYTRSTSSTQIKQDLSQRKRVYIFGAGAYGLRKLDELTTGENTKIYKVEGFLDNSDEKHLTRINGFAVYKPEDILRLEKGSEDFEVIVAMKDDSSARVQIENILKQNKK